MDQKTRYGVVFKAKSHRACPFVLRSFLAISIRIINSCSQVASCNFRILNLFIWTWTNLLTFCLLCGQLFSSDPTEYASAYSLRCSAIDRASHTSYMSNLLLIILCCISGMSPGMNHENDTIYACTMLYNSSARYRFD